MTLIGTRAQYANATVEEEKEQVGGPAYYISHETPAAEGGDDEVVAGTSVTLDLASLGLENATEVGTQTVSPITFAFSAGENSYGNAPKYYTSGTAVRCYPANTITISGKKIVKIEVVKPDYGHKLSISADSGSYENDVWTGEAETVVLTFDPTATSGQTRLSSLVVTYAE